MADCKRCDICWGHFDCPIPLTNCGVEGLDIAPMWGAFLLRSDSSEIDKIDICPSCAAKIKNYILNLIESSSD